MKFITKFFYLLSFACFAQENFTRYQAENDWFRDYTREEMSSRFGETRGLLPLYACNGVTEFDPFWMPRSNSKRNSLRIQLYQESGKLIYQKGRYFGEDGSEILEPSNPFLTYLMPVMKKLERIPDTKKLLRNLERSPYPLTIAFGGNSFNPKEESGRNYHGIYMANAISILDHGRMTSEAIPFYDIGVGGIINWNPKSTEYPGEVSLAHEMYHAIDSARGILDMRFIQGDGYEMAFVSEYRAVYFENIVRKANKIPLRTHYGLDDEGPGVLDANGNSRFISSPCLK